MGSEVKEAGVVDFFAALRHFAHRPNAVGLRAAHKIYDKELQDERGAAVEAVKNNPDRFLFPSK